MLTQDPLNISESLSFSMVYGNYTMIGLLVICLAAISLSAYVKIATVLGIVRAGLGFASIPSAFVTGALAFSLSYCVMYPVIQNSSQAMDQVLRSEAPVTDSLRARALSTGITHWAGFLTKQSDPQEIKRFSALALQLNESPDESSDEISKVATRLHVLAPAFLVSELKEAFSIGLRVFLPFVVIDLLVSLLISAVGIERQVSVSLGFVSKILLFVLCDGWSLIAGSLVSSYAV